MKALIFSLIALGLPALDNATASVLPAQLLIPNQPDVSSHVIRSSPVVINPKAKSGRHTANYDLTALNGKWKPTSCTTKYFNTGYIQETNGAELLAFGEADFVSLQYDRNTRTLLANLTSALYELADLKNIDEGAREERTNYSNSKTWSKAFTSKNKISVVRWNTLNRAVHGFSGARSEKEMEASLELKRAPEGQILLIQKVIYVQGERYISKSCVLQR